MGPHFIVGYCHRGMIHHAFHESMLRLRDHDRVNREALRGMIAVDTLYLALGRNDVVRRFLEFNAEWLLFVDTDIKFEPEQVYALLDHAAPDRPIVAGLYFTWMDGEMYPCWFEKRGTEPMVSVENITIGQMQRLSVCGMGFTAIHRDALLKMQAERPEEPCPWFGHDVIKTKNGLARAGEDVTFCMRAEALDIPIWGYAMPVSHVKSHIENLDSFLRWRR